MANPLDLGMVCAVATPLAATVKSSVIRYVLVATFMAGAALAQARTALVVVAAGIAYVVASDVRRLLVDRAAVWSRSYLRVKRGVWIMLIGTLLLGSTAYAVIRAGLFEKVFERFSSSTTTDQYRLEAYSWLVRNIEALILFGRGTYEDPRSIGATTSSLENTYFIFTYQFGLLFAGLLLVLHLAYVLQLFKSREYPVALGLAGSAFILMINAYAGLGATPYFALMLSFLAAGIVKNGSRSATAELTHSILLDQDRLRDSVVGGAK